jgi:hypothetical protein
MVPLGGCFTVIQHSLTTSNLVKFGKQQLRDVDEDIGEQQVL